MVQPMSEPKNQPQWWQRSLQMVAGSRPGAWFSSRALPPLDRVFYRLSGGRYTATGITGGVPIIVLTTTGAKSGQPRTVQLIGIPDGDDIVLIASNWGGVNHPGWYFNLRAHPQASLAFYGRPARPYVAREVFGAERDAYWRKAVAVYRGYDAYKTRTGGREIPIMVLTPIIFK
jgi:deazaflavin-dependent oxidoreductase (nitroreductase family)